MNSAQLQPLVRHLRSLVEAQATRDLSDAQLLEQFVCRRDEAAFATLMCRHGGLVWHVCRHVLHQEQDAEDAFQASFLVLALKAASLRRGQGLGNWLYGVAYRVAMNAKRKAVRRQVHERRGAAARPRALPAPDALHELQTLLHEEINHLPAKYRVPLVLCGLEGKSKSEAARELGWKEGTVSGRLARARTMLAARLARRGVMLSAAWAATTLCAEAKAAVVPPTLVWATTDAARHFAAGKALTAGIVSSQVAALMKGALNAASLTKLKLALTLVLGLSLLGAGAGLAAYKAFTNEPPFSRELPASASDDKPAPPEKQPRVDLYGDALPKGAIARLGTVRLFHRGPVRLAFNSPVSGLLYSPDGKTVFSGGLTETIRCWNVDSGKEVRQFVVPQGKMLAGHWLVVGSLALSPDGKTLAAGTLHGPMEPGTGGFPQDHQGLFYLWDVASGKLLHQGQGDYGSRLAFSRDGKVLASGGGGKPSQVRLWEVSTGKELRQLPVDCPGMYHVTFSPSSDTLAVVGRDSTIFIMDAGTRKVLHKLKGHINVIHGVAFSRDGKTLASIEAGRPERDPEFYVRLWSVESGKLLRRLGHQKWIDAIAFGADGMLAALGHDGIHLWDSQSGKQLRHFSGPPPSSTGSLSLAFSPDGKTLACGDGDGVISFWDVGTGTHVRPMPRHQMGLNSVAVSPDGRTAATASSDRSIGLWDVASSKQLCTLRGHKDRVQFVAFSSNGKLLASASFDDYGPSVDDVFLWDLARGEIVQRLKGRCLAFSPDGKLLACGGFDNENPRDPWPGIIRLHEVETGKLIRRFQGHKVRVQNLAFSPDGKTLASASLNTALYTARLGAPVEDFTLRLWDVASGRERCQVDSSTFNPSILTFSPDGRLLVTLGENLGTSNQLRIWEVATGKKRRVLDLKKSGSVTSILFLPDGRTLAVGGSRDEIEFFDLATGQERGCIRGHYGAVTCLALSADAKKLFSGSADTTALVWDLPSAFTPRRTALEPLPQGGVGTLWADLASVDAAKADQAIWTLVRAGNEAVASLDTKLKPAKDDPMKRIPQLLADLDSNIFAAREAASKELEELLPEGEERLQKALKTNRSAEVRRRLADLLERNKGGITALESLRRIRALEVLEHIATAEARDALKKLAAGAPEAPLTQEAKAAVDRLTKRATAKP